MGLGNSPVSMAGALRETLDNLHLGYLLHESKLRNRWRDVMGERAAEVASLDSMQDWVLNVRVSHPVWRQELHFQRDAIRQRANEILGASLIRDVRLH